MDDAVVAVDNDQATAGDRRHLDRGDPEAEVAREAHTEDFILDRLGVAIDLWLEDVRRWGSFDRATPASIGHPRQDELLLHAGKRDADATSDAQRGAAEVGNELSDFRLSERFGGQGRWIRRWRVVGRLDDQGTGAVSAKGSDQTECVLSEESQAVGDDLTRLILRQEPIQEGPDQAVGVTLRRKRQRE